MCQTLPFLKRQASYDSTCVTRSRRDAGMYIYHPETNVSPSKALLKIISLFLGWCSTSSPALFDNLSCPGQLLKPEHFPDCSLKKSLCSIISPFLPNTRLFLDTSKAWQEHWLTFLPSTQSTCAWQTVKKSPYTTVTSYVTHTKFSKTPAFQSYKKKSTKCFHCSLMMCVPNLTFKGMWPQIVQESSGSQGNNHVLKS